MFNLIARRRETELDRKIAAANAAIEASKEKARAELAIAESKLAARIAERDAAPVQFYRAYNAAVNAQAFVCDQLRAIAA
jgi:F0F1-type ATP synthase membrane subunit b/b'